MSSMTLDIGFYVSRFFSRLHYFLLFSVLGAGIGIGLAMTLPPVYRAQAVLVVESPQIPGELAESTVQASAIELLQIIQQRILTRANLLDMAREYAVYEDIAQMSPDLIVENMRQRVEITLPQPWQAAAFVRVGFPASDPELSASVTNALVTQILEESVRLRTDTTGQTLDFFEQEVQRLGEELGRAGAKILEFQMAHREALPDSLEFRRNRQSTLQERLLQTERELASLRDRRTRLVELYDRTGRVDIAEELLSPEERQLQQLRSELASALVVYSPSNPRVTMLQARVEQLEEQLALEAGENPDLGLTAFDIQVGDIDAQMEFLAEQVEMIEAELADLQRTIDATPGNAVALSALERDYENIQLQYNHAVESQSTAATGDRIEVLSRGQRVTVIEQAGVPRQPDSPNRKLIAAAGAGGGMALGAAAVVILEFLTSTIQRPADLAGRLGITPFATIPYISTRGEILRRRLLFWGLLLAIFAGIPAALYAVHVHYLPLDLLAGQALERLGLGGLAAQLGLGNG